MEQTKKWWLSKTIWINLLALAGSVALALGVDSENWTEITAICLAIVNIGLRLATQDKIQLPTNQ
jgi:hypothetical protein